MCAAPYERRMPELIRKQRRESQSLPEFVEHALIDIALLACFLVSSEGYEPPGEIEGSKSM